MLDNFPLLTVLTFSPLIGILILMFIPKRKGNWIKIVGIGTTLIPLLLSVMLYLNFDMTSTDKQFVENKSWIDIPLNMEGFQPGQYEAFILQFKYIMGVDGISLSLVFLTALVSVMAALASLHIKKRWKSFYILFLLLQIGMFGVFFSNDLFLFFLFFELTLIPMFFLISIWGYKNREKAANSFLIYNGIGSAIMLVAFFMMIATAGFQDAPDFESGGYKLQYSANYTVIQNNLSDEGSFANTDPQFFQNQDNPFYINDTMRWMMFIMLLVAFGIKLPIFPFHTWMLKVHKEAPPSIVMIHSGVLLKMGAYGLLRFGVLLFPEQAKSWAFVLAILGVINILYGAILAFVQKEFKLILAFSSISHMGIVLLGIAAFNVVGLEGAVVQLVSHGLISALLFLIVGTIYERTRTTQLGELAGLSKSMPFVSGILLVAGMASLGLPGLSGFVSEFLSFLGLFDSMPIVTVVGTLGIILTAVYVLRGVLSITFGSPLDHHHSLRDARFIEALPMIVLVAFIVLIGVYPAIITDQLEQTIQHIMTRIGG